MEKNNPFLMILFSCTIFTIVLKSAEARVLDFKLEVNSGVDSDLLTINGASPPAPTLFAHTNNTLILQVINCLPNVTDHPNLITFEGHYKMRTRDILPGETVTYQFITDFPGTYMYRIYLAKQKEATPAYGLIRVADDSTDHKLPLPPPPASSAHVWFRGIKLEYEDGGGFMGPPPLSSPKQYEFSPLIKVIVVVVVILLLVLGILCLIRMFSTSSEQQQHDGSEKPTEMTICKCYPTINFSLLGLSFALPNFMN